MGISSVLATDSSGGSSERLGVDFCGDAALISDLVVRSGRPERLEVVDEWCDCGWPVLARELRLGSAILWSPGRVGEESWKVRRAKAGLVHQDEEGARARRLGWTKEFALPWKFVDGMREGPGAARLGVERSESRFLDGSDGERNRRRRFAGEGEVDQERATKIDENQPH